jgi:protein-disulfide isomerase
MTANTPPKKSNPTGSPSTARRSARTASPAGKSNFRAVARAGTAGAGRGVSPLVGWTIAFVALAVVVIGVVMVVSVFSAPTTSPGLTTPTVLTPTTIAWSGRTLGKADAPVTVDLYGDFRCSGCANFTIGGSEASLVADYVATGRAKLVWHDRLIIDEIRKDGTASRDAANAAMCAADQNKFWVMHDWLYANQSATEEASAFTAKRLSDIAQATGLDMAKFQPCLDAGTHNAEITAANASVASAIVSTPTIYVNKKMVVNPTEGYSATYAQIKAAIDAEPATAPTATSAAPTPPSTPTPAVTIAPSNEPSVKPS